MDEVEHSFLVRSSVQTFMEEMFPGREGGGEEGEDDEGGDEGVACEEDED